MVKAIRDTCCSPDIPCATPEKCREDATNIGSDEESAEGRRDPLEGT